MLEHEKPAFDTEAFLASAGLGRTIVRLREKQALFSQGDSADSVFYLQSGQAKLTVVAKNGKEATSGVRSIVSIIYMPSSILMMHELANESYYCQIFAFAKQINIANLELKRIHNSVLIT